jgi:hypothetical protein
VATTALACYGWPDYHTGYGAINIVSLMLPNFIMDCKRNLKQQFRFLLFSQKQNEYCGVECRSIWDKNLISVMGCFVRLRMFDPAFQEKHKITGRMVCTDLDTVIPAISIDI